MRKTLKKSILILIILLLLFSNLSFATEIKPKEHDDKLSTSLIKEDSSEPIYDVYLTGTFYYDKAKEVFDKLNEYRKSQGLTTLTLDKDLFEAAMERAKEIALFFDHTRPDGTTCYTVCDIMEAENIAAGSDTSEGTMNQWKNSPGHNSNMLGKDWNSVGIGCYCSGGMYYWVQCFSSSNGTSQENLQANKTEKQVIHTLEDKIKFYYNDKTELSLNIGDNAFLGDIYTINTKWEFAKVLLEKESMNYSSTNTNVATVDSNGKITAVAQGNTIIKASIGNKSVDINLRVVIPNYGKNLMAAIEKENEHIMNVLLPADNQLDSQNNILTRSKVEELLREKYNNNEIVDKIYGLDGKTEVTKNEDKVGTGYKIKLISGEDLTVALYGDVNCDGIVDINDTVKIAEHNVGKYDLNKYQEKAAYLTEKESGKVDISDTVRVAVYNVNGLETGEALLDMFLFPIE